jgi:formylglycine-generating enzyme required for sulfatase activity
MKIINIIGFLIIALLVFGCQQQRHPAESEMVFVKGGDFWMGCSQEQVDCDVDEAPLHKVTVSGFYIAKHEVTQAQWQQIMGTTVSQQKDKVKASLPLSGEGDNYPMYYINWEEAQEFITRLNALTGKQYRLPTEAEWEYAARGGDQSKGYIFSGSNFVESAAWFKDNSGNITHPVGTKEPNELGIYDMSGNVWEWCYDWYGAYPAPAQHDPVGASSGSRRVNRGGGWNYNSHFCRAADRDFNVPSDRRGNLGFRLACSSK